MDLSAPLHLQALERFLDVNRLLKEVEEAVHDPVPIIRYSWNDEDFEDDEILVDIDHRPDDKYIYDMSELTEDNMWLKYMLMSDSSDSSDDEEMTETEMRRILRRYKAMKKITESIRHQSSQYSGYSTAILASSDVPFHLDPPEDDIDHSTVPERREKRVKKKKREPTPPPQLTIRDMIDALTTSMDTSLPEALIIENGKVDDDAVEKAEVTDEVPRKKAPADVWKSVVEEAYIFSRKRKYKLELHSCKRAKICSEIQRGLTKLKSIRPLKQEVITIPDDQSETVVTETDNAHTVTMEAEALQLSPLAMDVEKSDQKCCTSGNSGDVKSDSNEDIVIIEVERDKPLIAPSDIIIVDLEDIADVEEEINKRIKESVDENIEISEEDIFDQFEIVNKKKEEIAEALKVLEDKIRREQEENKRTRREQEEIEFTEEDMLEDVITVEDLEIPELTGSQARDEVVEQAKDEIVKEDSEVKVLVKVGSDVKESVGEELTEPQPCVKTVITIQESAEKKTISTTKASPLGETKPFTAEATDTKTTEDTTVLAKKCLSDIVSSVPEIL